MKEDLRLYFSIISGELYHIEEDEIKNLDETQIPLLKKPSSSCKKCYGRFYVGQQAYNTPSGWKNGYYLPCPKCAKKCVDFSRMKSEVIDAKKLNTTTELV